MVAKLLPTSNRKVGATSIRDEHEREQEVQHKPVTNKRRKEINAMMKILVEESTKVRKLPRPIRVRAVGTAEIGDVSIVGSTTVLGPSSMSVTTRQE